MSSKSDAAANAAKKFRSHMALSESGWNQASHSDLAGPVVWCYMFDLATNWTWMCTMSLQGFVEMSLHGHDKPSENEAVRGGIAHMVSLVSEGSPPEPVDGLTWEQQLGGLLALYAGSTKTWELAGRFKKGGHFVVLNYRKPGEQNGLLRPFALGDTDSAIIPAGELQSTIKQVIAADRQRHPDWFA